MPKKHNSTVRRTTSRTRSSSTPQQMGLIAKATVAECSASTQCALDNLSHRTPLMLINYMSPASSMAPMAPDRPACSD